MLAAMAADASDESMMLIRAFDNEADPVLSKEGKVTSPFYNPINALLVQVGVNVTQLDEPTSNSRTGASVA